MYVRRAGDDASAGRSRPARMNGAVTLHSWTSSSSIGSTSSTRWIQLLTACGSGTRPPASTALAGRDPLRRGRARRERQVGERLRRRRPVRAGAVAQPRRVVRRQARAARRSDLGQRARRQGRGLGGGEQRVGLRGAAHGLGGVVDEDVQRALRRDAVGERDDLTWVAQVDPDDAQAIQPVGAVGHRREAAGGVARKARGDRRVGAVAQQPQRDVHADLRPPAGEQRAPAGEVGAGVAAGAVALPRRPDRAGGRRRRPRGSAPCRRSSRAPAAAFPRWRPRRPRRAAGPASRRRCARARRSRWRR